MAKWEALQIFGRAPKDRKQRIVRSVIERILELAKNRWDMVCLKAVIEAKGCIKE